MPRVLIVTSTYAPAMIADMHRARQLAWELPKLGWQVEILTPDVSYQPASCRDDDSRRHIGQVPTTEPPGQPCTPATLAVEGAPLPEASDMLEAR